MDATEGRKSGDTGLPGPGFYPDSPGRSVLLILVPMLLTFLIQRVVLHHSSPDTHVFVRGYLVHHLFWGILVLVPTAFLLGLGLRTAWQRDVARVALGFSSAMVLDEVVYLVCTDGSGVAYRGAVSLRGAFVMLSAAALFLAALYVGRRKRA